MTTDDPLTEAADGAPYHGDTAALRRDLDALGEFERTHEATDAHLYGRCDCPRQDPDHICADPDCPRCLADFGPVNAAAARIRLTTREPLDG